jgi:hypothetical protein
MSTFADEWDEAGQEDNFDPPDGAYLVRLYDGGAFSGRVDNKNYVKLKWELLDGPDAGRYFEDFKGISNKVGLRITREKLVTLGLDPEGIETIEALNSAICKLIGTKATITVVHDGPWCNVSVLAAETDESDAPADTTGLPDVPEVGRAAEDSIPFHHEEVSWDARYRQNR